MKYFSLSSWDILYAENEDAIAYEAYLSEVRVLLPKGLQSLTAGGGSISLNDSRVQRLEILAQEGVVNIFLNGKRIEGIFVGRRTFLLQYTGVKRITSSEAPDLGGLFMGGYGLHGFDEVEVLEEGLYEHRMLFSSGIEIGICFNDFQLYYTDD
jgi:hypothetical protein